jgi:antitoxin ParD1/3/4
MPTSVALGPHFETFVRQQVDSGRYNNVSEVVRAGLRLLEDEAHTYEAKLAALRAAIAEGEASGEPIDAQIVFAELEAELDEMARRKKRGG